MAGASYNLRRAARRVIRKAGVEGVVGVEEAVTTRRSRAAVI